jgi:uncharacterized membrane protein
MMRNPRSLPGVIQFVIAVCAMVAFGLVADAIGVPSNWAGLVGIFLGSLVMTLWEAASRRR